MVVQNYLTYLEQEHSDSDFYIKALLVNKGENLDFDIFVYARSDLDQCQNVNEWIYLFCVKIQAVGDDPEAGA